MTGVRFLANPGTLKLKTISGDHPDQYNHPSVFFPTRKMVGACGSPSPPAGVEITNACNYDRTLV